MTTMIYRGVKHNGHRSAKLRTAKDLIYRGVAHDGMTAAPAARLSRNVMCYRGVRYIFQAGDKICAIGPAVAAYGSDTETIQVA